MLYMLITTACVGSIYDRLYIMLPLTDWVTVFVLPKHDLDRIKRQPLN